MTTDDVSERLEALETRLQELEDERAILQLIGRYGFNADACRDTAFLALWTDDGVMDVAFGEPSERTELRWAGKDELGEFITDPQRHRRPGFYGRSLHIDNLNTVIHIDGDRAIVNGYSLVLRATSQSPKPVLISAGANEWVLRREDGEWLIEGRRRRDVGDHEMAGLLGATPS
jgi:SnoaL-like protein